MLPALFFGVVLIGILSIADCCSPPNTPNKVTLGDDTYVCLSISLLNWMDSNHSFIRVPSKLKTDKFSSITVPKSWTSSNYSTDLLFNRFPSNGEGQSLAVAVESMGVLSYQKVYRTVSSNATQVTFPLMMAIIYAERGHVKSVFWDNNCKWCSTSQCVANAYGYYGEDISNVNNDCFVEDSECISTEINTTTNALCQLRVYIAWSGTDSNGNYFQSAASRLSRYDTLQLKKFVKSQKSILV